MVLLVADEGPLRAAIMKEFGAAGIDVCSARVDDEDLWLAARNQQAIVYVPAANLLEGQTRPSPDPERMRAVLGAAEAPGVEVVVPVFPAHAAYDDEVRVMKRYGKPYAALSAHPLVEEIAELVPEETKSLYLPSIGRAEYCRAASVAVAVLDAIVTEQQGRVTAVESEVANASDLVREAVQVKRVPIRVRALWPWLYWVTRPWFGWFRQTEVRIIAALAEWLPELEGRRRQLLHAARR